MVEVQAHGLSFEKWVRRVHFADYEGKYGQKWDVPAEFNRELSVPSALRDLPVSIKTARYGSTVNLGDILRQRGIAQDFVMIVGFWEQRSPTEKWIVEIGVARFTVAKWASLWGSLSAEQLCAFDAKIKDLSTPHAAARQFARNWKRSTPEVSTSVLVVNPKIDSKSQRRVQCSLPFSAFWESVGARPLPKDQPALFGHVFPNPIRSAPRQFHS